MSEVEIEVKEIPEEIIIQYHNLLRATPEKMKYLMQARGISEKTITKYKIGYQPLDPKHPIWTDRYTIPIKDTLGSYINIRKLRKPKNPEDPKVMPYAKGYGKGARLFPIENMYTRNSKIILCEGEWDCLLLNQHKFNAITKTAAVGVWEDEWNLLFKDKDVIIIYDCQAVSRDFAEKHKDRLIEYANSIKIIDLGLKGKGEDITDWFLKYKKTAVELAALIKSSKVRDIYQQIDLSHSLEARYYNQKIKFCGLIVGMDTKPFIIPKTIKVSCNGKPRAGNKSCDYCPVKDGPVNKTFKFETHKATLIAMINSNDTQVTGFIRKEMHLPSSRFCPYGYNLEFLETLNIEQVSIIPEINHEIIKQDYVMRTCYFFGSRLALNQVYQFRGTTWADPNNQSGIHLVTDAKEAKDSISKFKLDAETKEALKIFRPEKNTVKSIKKKLDEIYNDFTYNVTKMYERKNLLMAVDLVYHSILNFEFIDGPIEKGWLECLIIGDTKCGKSKTAERIVKHYKAGEFISSSENTSRAGLLGGEQQTNRGSWNVTWGKLVMNDNGICVLDEIDALCEKGIIAQLSGVRSSGVAELVQIQSGKANARTRIIWISNPLYGRMSEHNYGVVAIKDLFKTPQDISRIDFGVGVDGDDVPDDIINKRNHPKVNKIYTSKICHKRVMFAWSREYEQIRFTKDATEMILELSTKMGKDYSPDIPLVVGSAMREKLARISVSIAVMVNSVDDRTGEIVVVHATHVRVGYDYLEENYDSEVMGYKEYSEQRKRKNEIKDTKLMDESILNVGQILMLLDKKKFQLTDIIEIFETNKGTAQELTAYMRKNRIMEKPHNDYIKTRAFIQYLKKKKEEMEGKPKKNTVFDTPEEVDKAINNDDIPF